MAADSTGRPDWAGVLDLLPQFPAFFYELRGVWDGRPRFRYMSTNRYITGHDVTHWRTDFAASAELIHADDRRVYRALGQRVLDGETDISVDYRERSVRGDYLWVREGVRRGVDAAGAPTLSGFCVDVTAARTHEARVVERERRLRAVMQAAASQLVEFDASGRLVHLSIKTISGYSSGSFGNDPTGWLSIVVDDDRERVQHVMLDAFDRKTGCDITFCITHRDTSIRTIRLLLTYFAGELGAPGWVGVLTDITAQSALEQRARLADLRARALERRARARVYRWRNGSASTETGGISIRLDIHPHDVADFNSAHEQAIGAHAACEVDFRWRRHASDGWRWVRASVWSLGDGQTALGVFLPDDGVVDREQELSRIHETLTTREREVLRRLATGSSNRELAGSLHLSEKTVSHHVASVLEKLNLANRAAAAALASRLSLDE
jgi:PAS domain S-box-containing protein